MKTPPRRFLPATPIRARSGLLGLLALVLLSAGCGGGCSGCSSPSVAVIASSEGVVERDHVTAIETWEAATPQAGIALGEGVRTAAGANAQLTLTGGGGLRMGPGALVRFGGQPDEAPSIELGAGEIEVEAGEAMDVVTEFGRVRLEQGARVRATHDEDGARVEVLFGLAQVDDGARLSVGEVFDSRSSTDEAPATGEEVPDAGLPRVDEADVEGAEEDAEHAPDVDTGGDDPGSQTAETRVPGISAYEFSVSPGAGGVIHHPAPPAVVGIRTGCADGEVVVDSGGAPITYTGGGTVGVRMGRGRSSYEVRCGGQTGASGRFSVTSDSGRHRLDTRSQRHRVDADGRRYTFLYEGALPTLVLRWPNAPAAEQYTVRLTGTRGAGRVTSATPTTTVPRSALRDGEMSFQFSADGRTSPNTSITLRYDTATPTAYVASPSDQAFGPGASVQVEGTAQPGSRVGVGGQEYEVSRQGDFSGTGTAERGGLAVRITTPNQGVHYFVRRSSGG